MFDRTCFACLLLNGFKKFDIAEVQGFVSSEIEQMNNHRDNKGKKAKKHPGI